MDGKGYFDEVSVERRNMLLQTAKKIIFVISGKEAGWIVFMF